MNKASFVKSKIESRETLNQEDTWSSDVPENKIENRDIFDAF